VAGATTAVAGVTMATKPQASFAVELGKKHDNFPLEVDKDLKRFNQKDHVFARGFWDDTKTDDFIYNQFGFKTIKESGLTFGAVHAGIIPGKHHGKLGYRQIDEALDQAAWSVDANFATNSEVGIRNTFLQKYPINPMTGEKNMSTPVFVDSLYSWDNSKVDEMLAHGKEQYKFKDTNDATTHLKKAAKHLGADLVGIAPYDENTKRWTYDEWMLPNVKPFTFPDGRVEYMPFNPFKFMNGEVETFGVSTVKPDFKKEAGFEPKSVIVLAFEMDYAGFRAAPTLVASAAAGVIYSKMAETAHKVADFLRRLGYKAAPCGNDTALSVPLAIEAGLGESSRMGMIVTEKYGPRVRIAKIYTDLDLTPDKPITFGVKEFCNVCMKCADACPSKSISHEPAQVIREGMEFSTGKVTSSTMLGVEKWFVNGERCVSFWAYNGGDCGTCISVCPYNKIDEWHHDLSKLMTLTPFKPLLRSLDEFFGYGGPIEPEVRLESKYLKDAVNDFWEK
jgi:reductive dehalogenase